MNAGFSNFDALKKHLLASSLGAESKWDIVLQDIGLGVAGMIEEYCQRQFARVVGDQAIFQMDRVSFVMPRFPLETISAVDVRMGDQDTWQAQDLSYIRSTSLASGMVYLPDSVDAGKYWTQVRFTYTGGFWWEQLEPDDANYPSSMPTGARALPAPVRLAWLTQCREVWSQFDKLGQGIVDTPGKQSGTASLDLVPMVKQILANYVVMQPI